MSYNNPRLTLEMSMMDMVMAFSEGNPGALNVIMSLMENEARIDPDSFVGGLGTIMQFDNMDIYGSKIWLFYKDLCGEDIVKVIALARAIQLGIIPERDVKTVIDAMADYQPYEINFDLDTVVAKVQEQLPEFAADYA